MDRFLVRRSTQSVSVDENGSSPTDSTTDLINNNKLSSQPAFEHGTTWKSEKGKLYVSVNNSRLIYISYNFLIP